MSVLSITNIQIILCNTSHPGNIGAAARAMKTMGLSRLILVAPRAACDDHAIAISCNARDIVENATIVPSLKEAIADSVLVIAMTGRKREFSSELLTAREIVPEILELSAANQQVSIVFGNEQHGLSIEDQEQCNRLVTIPSNPEYSSLNLAQAVQVMCYEIYSNYRPEVKHLTNPVTRANQNDIQHLLKSLEQIMLKDSYYEKKNPARVMRRLQKILHKANLEREEVDLLHGIFRQHTRNF